MFDDLSGKFNQTFKKLTNKGVLTEANIGGALKDVKMALLEADVNYRVVNAFLKSVKARALGKEVMKSLTPGQQFIKIVSDELASLMGTDNRELAHRSDGLTSVMLVGLQGSGKTTTLAKLANKLKNEGKSVFLVPADIYRPAAIEQLKTLAREIDVPCFDTREGMKPVDIVEAGRQKALERNASYSLIDTAGRLQIDDALMGELEDIKASSDIDEILFVADAMTGQEAVNVAKVFHEKIKVTGFILTKMDGDARGGAALSIRAITGMPVMFIGVGEKISDLDSFFPDRIASKILGMGDMVTLLEKAQEHFDDRQALELEERIRKNTFSLENFQEQLAQIQKMGSITDLLGMIPGMNTQQLKSAAVDEKALDRVSAMISSMTLAERQNHNLINGPRKIRIANGSGTQVSEINKMLKQFVQMKKMMKKFANIGDEKKAMRALKDMMGPGM